MFVVSMTTSVTLLILAAAMAGARAVGESILTTRDGHQSDYIKSCSYWDVVAEDGSFFLKAYCTRRWPNDVPDKDRCSKLDLNKAYQFTTPAPASMGIIPSAGGSLIPDCETCRRRKDEGGAANDTSFECACKLDGNDAKQWQWASLNQWIWNDDGQLKFAHPSGNVDGMIYTMAQCTN